MTATFPQSATMGFVLLDASMNPIWFNAAGIGILSYPEKADPSRVKALLAQKLGSVTLGAPTGEHGLLTTEFISGKRHYICRTLLLKSCGKGASNRAIALLLERSSGWTGVSHLAEEFKLSPRQVGVVQLLTQGLTNKEIASRMSISSNTVKAHIRLIMIKTRVSTRSGLLGKIIGPSPMVGVPELTERRGDVARG